jgi:hypothetical protein
MKFRTSVLVATAALFPATTAFADVTPQEVWAQGLVTAKISGQTWTAAELEQTGDTLIAHDVAITMPGFSEIMAVNGTIPQVVMKQLSGGQVEVTIPDVVSYDVSVKGRLDLGMAPMTITSTMAMDNVMIASGTADNLKFEILPGSITYATQKQVKDGVAIVPEQIVTLLGVQGVTTQKTSGDDLSSKWDVQADAVSMVSDGTTPDITLNTSYKIAPFNLSADFTTSATPSDAPLGFLEALNGTGTYSMGNTAFEMTTGSAEQMMHIVGETEASTLGVTIADGSLTYAGTSANTEAVLDGSAIPFPQVDFGLESTEFSLTMPFLASEDDEAFGLTLALENLRLPEIAWMILDPSTQMAHDPATLKLDVSGDMMLNVDLLNPTDMMNAGADGLPLFPTDLTLNELFLSAAGATLTGTGNAIFVDKGDFDGAGLPFKTAQATLALTGGNALIDTLAQTGLVPPQMSTTAKVMLSMFARPGEGADTFITDVALDAAGNVTVNGQPLPF